MHIYVQPQFCMNLPLPSKDSSFIRYGDVPVLITSVHGVAHVREDILKQADRGTFELGHLIAKTLGCTFYGQWKSDELDNNHSNNTEFKTQLVTLFKDHPYDLAIDIHSSHPARPYDVEIGTQKGRSLLGASQWRATLEKAFDSNHFVCAVDQYFCAEGIDGGETITDFISKQLNTPALQLEVSATIISGDGGLVGYHQRSKLVNAIATFWFER